MYHGVTTLTAGATAGAAVATGVASSGPIPGHVMAWAWLAVAALTLLAAIAAVLRLLPVWRRRRDDDEDGAAAYPADPTLEPHPRRARPQSSQA
jgi:hypothetical protein